MYACDAPAGAKLVRKNSSLFSPTTTGLLWEISYMLLFSVMTLHHHRLHQISSLEAEVWKI